MKGLSRRDFLKLCAGSAAAVSLSELLLPHLLEAAPASGNPPALWIQGASCTGCAVSLLDSEQPAIATILTDVISLKFHPNISGAAGYLATKVIDDTAAAGGFYLVVEGAVPTGANGMYCTVGETESGQTITFMDRVADLGSKAAAVLAVGTCASFGGIPAATYGGNPATHGGPTGCISVTDFFKQKGITTPVINVPGCPPHPDWMVGTLAHVLLYKTLPPMDQYHRPTMFYGRILHDNCQRRQYFDNSQFAKVFSEPYCLLELGCKGPFAACDSYKRQWNGVSSCILANGPCYACTDMNFPDGSSPIYQRYPDVKLPDIDASADAVGVTLGAAVVLGMAAHLIGNAVNGRLGHKEE